jgi:YbbR domain-containing protein
MDKMFDKPWFLKLLALGLAILLYTSVPHNGNKFIDVNVPGEETTATIQAIPVTVYYDTKNLVVSGIPNTVDITIKGPISLVEQAKGLKDFEVYVDLTNAKIGSQTVKFKVKNLSDKLKATITPDSVKVNVQEKITKEFKVEPEFKSSLLEDGYTPGQPIVEPGKVKITGAKNVIDQIAYVKAVVDEKIPVKDTITKEARVQVFDKDLNKLDVQIEPAYVKVTIPIKNTSKTVPINVIQKGTPPAGVSIDSIQLDTTQATIIGNEDVLNSTDNVRVEVDVSKITDNTTLTLPVIISNGITKVTPQTVKATVAVSKTTQKTISSVPINIRGLPNQYKAVINDPANQTVNLLVTGSSSVVNTLTPNDFNVYIDLSNLNLGNHNVNIQVDGPSGVKPPQLDKSTATVTINNA